MKKLFILLNLIAALAVNPAFAYEMVETPTTETISLDKFDTIETTTGKLPATTVVVDVDGESIVEGTDGKVVILDTIEGEK